MDLINFIHSIDPNNITTSDLFINYLDQSFLLYTLVPEDSKVMVSNNSLNSISFTIKTTEKNIAYIDSVVETTQLFRPYRKNISVDKSIDSDSINLRMSM